MFVTWTGPYQRDVCDHSSACLHLLADCSHVVVKCCKRPVVIISPVSDNSAQITSLPMRRYVAKEVLRDDHRNLIKADMFALGASLYELATDKRLAKGALCNTHQAQC